MLIAPHELKAKIFEPFFILRKDGRGTGLGLYLCRKIIDDYRSTLSVSDVLSGGTCFEITLSIDIVNTLLKTA